MSTVTSPPASLIGSVAPDQPFVRAKFRAPGAPRHLLRRHRLLALLDVLADYGVTAIVAPAGAGKTVLAADWLAHRQCPTTWVTPDATDRGPVQLWSSLVTAVALVAPGTLTGASRRLPAEDDIPTVLTRLRLPRHRAGPVTLVVDDVDTVDADERAGAVLTSFVEHRPAWLHLLLLSRRRLELPVERLRVSGDLADIHFDALRFSPVEAT